MISRLTSFVSRKVAEICAVRATSYTGTEINKIEQAVAGHIQIVNAAYSKGDVLYIKEHIKEISNKIDIEEELLKLKRSETQQRQQIVAALDTAADRLRHLEEELNDAFKR